MELDQLIDMITPEIYENLKHAVETKRWLNGDRLETEQLESSLTIIIAYEAKFVTESQRVGFINRDSKTEGDICHSSDVQTIRLE